MKVKVLGSILSVVVILFLVRLPVFPLITELREYSQEGERLIQIWKYVSLPEFYDAARFARSGGLDTTWRNYLILFAVNHAALIAVYFLCRRIIEGVVSWKKSPG